MQIQHIAAPHPAFSEVGPRLLMKEFAPNTATDLELFINKKFNGLELKCSCGTLNSLKNFSCAECNSSLELRQDLVIEDNSSRRVKPNTLRAWCTGMNWESGKIVEACHDPYTTEDNFPGKCTGCKKEGMLKYSGLVGNETTELMTALCLALSDKNEWHTTNFYQTFFSASSAKAALDLLVEFRYLKKKETSLTLSRLINQPDYFLLTPKGEKSLASYGTAFGEAGLLGMLNGFIAARMKMLEETQTVSKEQHFKIAASGLRERDLPEEVRQSLMLTEFPEDRFKKEIAKHTAYYLRFHRNELPAWLANFYGADIINFAKTLKTSAARHLYEVSPHVTEEEKIKILAAVGHNIKFSGLITPLRQYAENNMLAAVEQNFLNGRLAEPMRGVKLVWRGVLQKYEIQLPGQQRRIVHIASADRDSVYAKDYKQIWTPDMVEVWSSL